MKQNFNSLIDEIIALKERVAKLESEESREIKEDTIKPETKQEPKPQ